MTKTDVTSIERKLDEYDTMYYTFGQSEISDEEYDSLVARLKLLDPKNKRFKNKKVGAKEDPKSKWVKYKHADHRMGSQSKVNTFEDLKKWSEGYSSGFVVDEKLDGISIKLIYRDGELKVAATRGDGEEGEDIRANALKMNGVPSTIVDNREFIIRGEILLYHSDLEIVGGKTARNAAAGTAKRLDGKGCEHLHVKVYDIMNWKEIGFATHSEVRKTLKALGFDTVNSKSCKTVDEVETAMKEYTEKIRDSLDWDIDGLVVKTSSLAEDDWDYPKRSVAYKFPNQFATTRLVDVQWRDSGGRICPIGILEPVKIGGVTIGRATLNNIDHINKLGIKIGDEVVVSRRNDVIPCIEKVSIAASDGKPIYAPKQDEDGYDIVHEKNPDGKELVYLVSTNPNSSSMRLRRILSWFRSHDAKGVAGATIEAIMESGIATDLPAFYDVCLNGDQRLLDIEGFGKGTFKILHRAALLTSKTTLIKFFDGCDISGFGERSFTAILEHFGKETDVDAMVTMMTDASSIASISGFGDNTAKSLKDAVNKVLPIINEMKKRVEVQPWKPGAVNKNSKINGMSFCFTGKAERDRTVLEKMVKDNGGVVSGVSKNLNFLVTNEPNSGSGKNKKADQYGIKKISESDFINMVSGG